MTLTDALSLGRVSNLPTVWTNMLTGMVLAGGMLLDGRTPVLFVALTLFYVGGMYLNDAFDADIDAAERPERPIPAGRVSRKTVYVAGFGMLAGGIVMLFALGLFAGVGPWPGLSAIALSGAIVLYDWYHKSNPLSPVVMGVCRMLVYLCAGLCFVVPPPGVLVLSALVLLCYLIGLTYVAKQENLARVQNLWPLAFLAVPGIYGLVLALDASVVWIFLMVLVVWVLFALHFLKRRGPGDIPRAVVSLIAGISLLDAVFIAGAGALGYALLAVVGFALTLLLQRFIAGT